MMNTGMSVREYLNSSEYSVPYTLQGNGFKEFGFPALEHKILYSPRASGSVYSSVKDMTKWILWYLNAGEINGRPLIKKKNFLELVTPQISMETPFYLDFPEISHIGYSLGWFTDQYRSVFRVHHGGASMGFSSHIVLIPREKTGIVVLSNRTSMYSMALCFHIVDQILSANHVDWFERYSKYK